jgi:hypothetical protein
MTVTIDATVGGANSNSFITVAEGDDIAGYDFNNEGWILATNDDKIRALVKSTSELNNLPWVGLRATTTQALAWPRTEATINGREIPDDEIPREVKQATFDLALALLYEAEAGADAATAGNLIPGIPNSDLKRAKLDVLEIEWRTEGLPSNRTSTYSALVTRAPSLSTVLYGTLTSFGTGGSGLLVGVVRS